MERRIYSLTEIGAAGGFSKAMAQRLHEAGLLGEDRGLPVLERAAVIGALIGTGFVALEAGRIAALTAEDGSWSGLCIRAAFKRHGAFAGLAVWDNQEIDELATAARILASDAAPDLGRAQPEDVVFRIVDRRFVLRRAPAGLRWQGGEWWELVGAVDDTDPKAPRLEHRCEIAPGSLEAADAILTEGRVTIEINTSLAIRDGLARFLEARG